VAEFDEGVFGVQAAAQHYFGVDAKDLTRCAGGAAGGDPARSQRGAADLEPSSFVKQAARAAILRAPRPSRRTAIRLFRAGYDVPPARD
jgi:monofunctional biosynthetic peptidoglycan transglycosylase